MPIDPHPDLDHAGNFYYMLFGREPSPSVRKVIDACLILHAEHGFNASTFTARVTGSSLANPYATISAAVGSLSGPLHGGAPSRVLQMRLSYHALSRHYRLAWGAPPESYMLQQNFPKLEDALRVLKHVRNWVVVERRGALARSDYDAAVRMRLDTSLLPKPFQLSVLTSRELHLESPWKRFVLRAAQQRPAPVESREPKKEAER